MSDQTISVNTNEKEQQKEDLVVQVQETTGSIEAKVMAEVSAKATETSAEDSKNPPVPPDPEITILVSRDRMEAVLAIKKPPKCRPVLIDEVFEKIASAGVVYGVDHNAVEQAVKRSDSQTVCARGTEAQHGTNAFITLTFNRDDKGRPVQRDNGTVDYKNLNLFTTVNQDDLLAEKTPATAGTPGMDVLGHELPAKPGKDVILPAGKNVYIEENKIFSGLTGQVLYQNNKVQVIPVIEIKGDVDLSTGNIDFPGSVIVHGSVQAGFTVKAGGDIEINGTLSGGDVEGKNIIVRMGIQGMNRGYIKAVENVVAKFIENATIFAGNEVIVSDVILHSRVSAGKKVLVEGRKGLIAGGMISAGEEIRAKVVGSQLASSTDLEVGVNPLLREERQQLKREISKVQTSLDQAKKGLNILRSMNAETMPADKREMMLKLTKAQFQLMGQEETMKKRMVEIEDMLIEMRYGKIRVSEVVFPGAKIVVGSLMKPIREELKYVSFFEEEGEIKVGAYN